MCCIGLWWVVGAELPFVRCWAGLGASCLCIRVVVVVVVVKGNWRFDKPSDEVCLMPGQEKN